MRIPPRIANLRWLAAQWVKQLRQFTTESFGFSPGEVDHIMGESYARGDRFMMFLLPAHCLLAFGQAFFHSTCLPASLISAAALSAFVVSRSLRPRSFLTRCVA